MHPGNLIMSAPTLYIEKCDSYTSDVKESLLHLLRPFGWPEKAAGKRVAIKVNLLHGASPEKAVVTHPVLVKALSELLVEAGAESVVIGDSPGGLYTVSYLNHVYKLSQLLPCESERVHLNQNVETREGHYENAYLLHSFSYTAYLDDADLLIDFCKLKTHGMMGMSAAVKNMFGTIPGTTKPEYHMRFPNKTDFSKMLLDIYRYWHPDLCIVDAIDGMEGNGPSQGLPRHIGCLIAGTNAVEVDLVCAGIINLKPEDVPTLEVAEQLGLIQADTLDTLTTGGADWRDFVVRDYQNVAVKSDIAFAGKGGPIGRAFRSIARIFLKSRPQVRKKQCIGCAKCFQVCPARAITMKGKKPVIDRSQCIKCFCCQEFCPVGAMKVHRTPLAKLLSKNK